MALKIIIEGEEKSGKSTLAAMLEGYLQGRSIVANSLDDATPREKGGIARRMVDERLRHQQVGVFNARGGVIIETRRVSSSADKAEPETKSVPERVSGDRDMLWTPWCLRIPLNGGKSVVRLPVTFWDGTVNLRERLDRLMCKRSLEEQTAARLALASRFGEPFLRSLVGWEGPFLLEIEPIPAEAVLPEWPESPEPLPPLPTKGGQEAAGG